LRQIAAELPNEQAGWNMDAILRRTPAVTDEENGVEMYYFILFFLGATRYSIQ